MSRVVPAAAAPRRALVTGLAGQDGTLLALRLLAEGLEVHGTVRSPEEAAGLGDRPGLHVHVVDVTDHAAVADVVAAADPDELYHLAGVSSVALSWERPVLTGAVTGLGAVAVLEAARRHQDATGRAVHVVQASSAEIFGVPDRAPQDESTPVRPASPYGAAKAYAHHMAGVLRARGLFAATVVLYNHESPLRPPGFVTRKITAGAARIATEGGGELVLGDLSVRRDWGWAEDHVDAMVRAARHDRPDDFVVATGTTHSVEDLVRLAFARAGVADWRAHVRTDPAFVRPAEAAELVGDASKAARVLGWRPTVPFEEVVARMVDHDLALLRGGGPGPQA
ncbi:GDP-mannose 4,6-dehydratase [Cellulomonas endophytica]|uniref:GDP-mannose 4,6-dehydratase n=1 Tax=Cellulomonas endophytica TaxID=2494735 RepID=UPI001013B0FB|nr:GDP-mannose 4,6-dehydratase [Cellulomonas endophytica]